MTKGCHSLALVLGKTKMMTNFHTVIFINATVEKTWEAFVQPDQFFKAFYNANIKSSFKVGDRIEYAGMYDGQESVHIYGKILEYEAGKLLAYTDHPGPMYADNHAALESRVRVTFEATNACTKLSLTNDQFSKDNPMQAEAQQWYLILSNLKTWIETGQLMNIKN